MANPLQSLSTIICILDCCFWKGYGGQELLLALPFLLPGGSLRFIYFFILFIEEEKEEFIKTLRDCQLVRKYI